MMDAYTMRFDGWHLLLTLVPLAAGVLGSLVASRWTQHLGKIVVGYSLTCVFVSLSPQWLPAFGLVPAAPSRPVLVETKVMFILGILAILAAGGRAVLRAREAQAATR